MKHLPTAGLLFLLLSSQAWAARFGNQFVEFELPPQWNCQLEGTEWICQNTNERKKREAIIVLAAKLKGDQDSLDQYLSYLNSPKSFKSVQGKMIQSESKYAKTVRLNDHPWVDSLHSDSEVPGFFTRYLATIKSDISVLVTYSINKTKYTQYVDEFETLVKTLKVFRRPGGLYARGGTADPGSAFPTSAPAIDLPGGPVGGNPDPQPAPKEEGSMLPLLAIAGIVGYVIWRRRRNAAD